MRGDDDTDLDDVLNSVEQMTISETRPPAEDPNPDLTNAMFARELNKLSMKERDDVLQDVHGISDVMREDPEMVARSLEELDVELGKVEDKEAYLIAKQQNHAYVTDSSFVTMFLRAESFQAKRAATRMSSFFEMKRELFGADKLGRDITIDDLNEDDIKVLESGYVQVLQNRDRAGRVIFFLLPAIRAHKTVMNKLRALYIIVMNALKDVETQKRGFVGVAYNVGRDHTKDRDAVWKVATGVSILPMTFKGVHYCFDDEKVRMLFALAMFVFARNARIRCRLHFGTHIECIYNLMTFGIPSDTLPILPTGDRRLEGHQQFIQKIRRLETLNDNIQRILIPGTCDVLLGRGKPLQKHSGNLRYHLIVESFQDRYETASKLEKTNISKEIVEEIKRSGGRFLKQDKCGWVEIDDDDARYKVSHTFRNHRIAARAAQKKALAAQKKALAAMAGGAVASNNNNVSNHDHPRPLDEELSMGSQHVDGTLRAVSPIHMKRRRQGDL